MSDDIEFVRRLSEIGAALVVIAGSYALGCFNAAYYIVRWRTGQDIRLHSSGNAGATNAGRLLGRREFCLVLLLDLAKGVLIIAIARWLELPSWAVALTGIVVVAGHIWPAQLGLRGGKGIATSLGVVLILEPSLIVVLAVLCGVLFLIVRRFTISGLLAFALAPFGALALDTAAHSAAYIATIAIVVMFSHRKNLRDEWLRWRATPMRAPTTASKDATL